MRRSRTIPSSIAASTSRLKLSTQKVVSSDQGDFELALLYFHRGNKLRPELYEFRVGILKSREAINNSIGDPKRMKIHVPSRLRKTLLTLGEQKDLEQKRAYNTSARLTTAMEGVEKFHLTIKGLNDGGGTIHEGLFKVSELENDLDRTTFYEFLNHPSSLAKHDNMHEVSLLLKHLSEPLDLVMYI